MKIFNGNFIEIHRRFHKSLMKISQISDEYFTKIEWKFRRDLMKILNEDLTEV